MEPVSGLTPATSYEFEVKAKNGADVETAYSTYATGSTATPSSSVPTVTTSLASSITDISAQSGGNVTSDGGDPVTARGVAYDTNSNPTVGTSDGTGTGTYFSSLTGLVPNTLYYYRAYATNGNGTGYGSELNFITLASVPAAPTVNNPAPTTLDVTINNGGNPAGTEYVIHETTTNKFVQSDGSLGALEVWDTESGWSTITVNSLTPATQYTFEVKARNQNSVETAYGSSTSLYTLATTPGAPTVNNPTTSTLDVTINAGLPPIPPPPPPGSTDSHIAQAPHIPAGGATYSIHETTTNQFVQADGTLGGSEVFQTLAAWGTKTVTGLLVNRTYTFEVRAQNGDGATTPFGPGTSACTLANPPATPTVNGATSTSLNVNVNPNGNPATTEFAIHEISTNQYVQADGSLAASAVWQTDATWGTKTVTGLAPQTPYNFEVKARNCAAIESSFGGSTTNTTLPTPVYPPLHALLTDQLINDGNSNGQFNPGDGIRYRTVITNGSANTLTGVQLTEPAPTNTTFTPGSLKSSVLARNDSYNTPVNTVLNGTTVTANDFGLPSLTVVSFGTVATATQVAANGTNTYNTPAGGTVTMYGTGTFTYTPPPSYVGNDEFGYTAQAGVPPNQNAKVSIFVGDPVSPAPDAYSVIGNLNIAENVLTNDNPAASNPVVTAVNGSGANVGNATPTSQGGTVVLNANGTFSYNPPAGYEGTDNFSYTTNNGYNQPATGTVTMTIAGMVWFIDNNAPGGGDGRNLTPFNSIASLNAINNGTGNHPAANDNIFIYESNSTYTGPLVLLSGQKVIGQDASATLTSITGLTPQSYSAAFPTMNNLNVACVTMTTNGITLNSGNTVRGLTIGNVPGNKKIFGSSVGTLRLGNNTTPDLVLTGSGTALDVTNGTFTNSGIISIGTTASAPASQGVKIYNMAGSLTAGSLTVSSSAGVGLDINNNSATLNFGNTTISSNGGSGVYIQNSTAPITFGDLDIAPNSGQFGLRVEASSGQVNCTSGTISVTQGAAIYGLNSVLNLTFDAVSANNTGGVTSCINFTTSSGNVIMNGGTLISSSSDAFIVSGGSVNATYKGDLTANTAGAEAIFVDGGHTGTLTFNTGTVTSNGGNGMNFNNADGTYIFNGTTSITNTGLGISIQNGSGGSFTFGSGVSVTNPNNIAFNVDGTATAQTCGITYSGSIAQANNFAAVNIKNHSTGTVTFQTGTINATNGTGLQFDNTDATYNFTGTTTLNGGDAGVDITNGSAGAFNFASPSGSMSITNPSGIAFNVNGSTGSIVMNGSITKNSAGRAIEVQNKTSNAIAFNGNVTGSNTCTGINLATNIGGTMNFTGVLTLNGASDIFSATGGGTINVTNASNTIGNTSAPTTTAVNIVNTTIGGSGVTFQKVSATSSLVNSINLNNAGSGGFTITGNGAAGTGGTITHNSAAAADELFTGGASFSPGAFTNGIGIYIKSTNNVSLSWLNFSGTFGNFGIRGDLVNNFTMKYCNMTGIYGTNHAGDYNEGNIRFGTQNATSNGISGTALFEGNNLGGAIYATVALFTTGANTLNATFKDGTNGVPAIMDLNDTDTDGAGPDQAYGSDIILVESAGTSNVTLDVEGVEFKGSRGDNINTVLRESATHNVTIKNNTFFNMHPQIITGGGGIAITGGGAGSDYHLTYLIESNQFTGAKSSPIHIGTGGSKGVISGVILNNKIGVDDPGRPQASTALATTGASDNGNGINFYHEKVLGGTGPLTHKVRIQGNEIRDVTGVPIFLRSNAADGLGEVRLEATILNNIVEEVGQNSIGAIYCQFGGGGLSGDNAKLGVDIRNNTLHLDNTSGLDGDDNTIFIDQSSVDSYIYFPGYSGATTPPAANAGLSSFLTDPGHANVMSNGDAPSGGAAPTYVYVNALSVHGDNFVLTPVPLAAENAIINPKAHKISETQIGNIKAAAIRRLINSGISKADAEKLSKVVITISDQKEAELAVSVPGKIEIDEDAAGHGWFIDPTPDDDNEFRNLILSRTQPDESMDLLTVIMHEFEHQLGMVDDHDKCVKSLMSAILQPGERRLPTLVKKNEKKMCD